MTHKPQGASASVQPDVHTAQVLQNIEAKTSSNQPTSAASDYTAMLDALLEQCQLHYDDAITPETFLLNWQGIDFLPTRNSIMVKAPSKSGKTFFLGALASCILLGDLGDMKSNATGTVLYFDTEQSQNDGIRCIRRICRHQGTHQNLQYMNIKRVEPKQRLELVLRGIELYKPQLVILDGIADVIPGMDYNDCSEAVRILDRLCAASEDYDCAIVNAIHTNKKDDNATGWLGKIATQKCALVLDINKDKGYKVVTSSETRHQPIDEIKFDISQTADGLAYLYWVSAEVANEPKRTENIEIIMRAGVKPDTQITWGELRKALTNNAGEKNAARRINTAVSVGALRLLNPDEIDAQKRVFYFGKSETKQS